MQGKYVQSKGEKAVHAAGTHHGAPACCRPEQHSRRNSNNQRVLDKCFMQRHSRVAQQSTFVAVHGSRTVSSDSSGLYSNQNTAVICTAHMASQMENA